MRKNNIILLALLIFLSPCFNSASFAKNYGYFSSQDDNFKKYCNQGNEYIDKKDFNKAIKSYEEALKINPKQMQALGELCFCYSQIEDYGKMIETAKNGLLIAQQQISEDNIGRFYGYLGNAYKMQEKYDEAIKYLELAKYNKPYYYDNYLSLAYCYYKKKYYVDAIAFYDYLQATAPDYYEEKDLEKSKNIIYEGFLENDFSIKHLDAGQKYKKEKNYTAAIKEYNEILQKDPEDLTSLSEIIKCEVMNNTDNINELNQLCKKLLKTLNIKRVNDYEFFETVYKGLGYCCKKQKNAKMLSELKKLMESLSCLKEAKTQYYKDDDAAIANLKTAIEKQKDLEEAPYNHIPLKELIELFFRKREREEAKKYISIGLNRAKKDKDKNQFARYCKDIATYYSLTGKSNEALKYYEKGLGMTSDEDDKFKFYYGIALEYNFLKDWKTALKYLEKAKELLNKDFGIEKFTDIDSMIVKYKSLMDENSDLYKGNSHIFNANEYNSKGNYEEAVEEYAASLKYIPQNLDALYSLSCCLHRLKREEEAIEVANEGFAVAVRDKDQFYLDPFAVMLGSYWYEKEDYNKSIFYYKHVSDNNPRFPQKDTLSLIGTCYLLQHKYKEALEYYEATQKLDPDNEGLARQIERCRKLLKSE